jgi:hypothetical protein
MLERLLLSDGGHFGFPKTQKQQRRVAEMQEATRIYELK